MTDNHHGYSFGDRLREIREKRHLSQAQVARKVNISKTSVSNYENNICYPSVDILIKISLLLRVSTDYLLCIDNRFTIILDSLSQDQCLFIENISSQIAAQLKSKNK